MRIRRSAIHLAVFFCAVTLSAQQAKPAPDSRLKFDHEDERIRVTHVTLAPHDKLEMRSWMPHVRVSLTTSDLKVACKDRAEESSHVTIGEIAWSGGADCTLINGALPFEIVLVEFKNAKDPAKPLTAPPSPLPAGYLDEPFHHWKLENQYVRVYDVHIPVGATTGYHTHAYDTVFVEISGGNEASQSQGSSEWQPGIRKAGEVSVSPDSKKTRIHRVRNDGQGEYHVVAVQVLP